MIYRIHRIYPGISTKVYIIPGYGYKVCTGITKLPGKGMKIIESSKNSLISRPRSKATFFMKELREIFKEELVEIRKADVEGSAIDYEEVSWYDLAPEVQQAIDVIGGYMDRKDLGVSKTPTERINLLLDPTRKTMSSEDCVADVCVDNV